MTDVPAVGLLARRGLVFPAAELSSDGGPPAPGGVAATKREPLCYLVSAWRGLGPLQLEGLDKGLTGNGKLQGQAPVGQGGLRAWCARRLRAGLYLMRMREEGSDGRGPQRGLQAGL
jgi:hypothetical protein